MKQWSKVFFTARIPLSSRCRLEKMSRRWASAFVLAVLLGIAIHERALQKNAVPVIQLWFPVDLGHYQTGEESRMSESTSYFPPTCTLPTHTCTLTAEEKQTYWISPDAFWWQGKKPAIAILHCSAVTFFPGKECRWGPESRRPCIPGMIMVSSFNEFLRGRGGGVGTQGNLHVLLCLRLI